MAHSTRGGSLMSPNVPLFRDEIIESLFIPVKNVQSKEVSRINSSILIEMRNHKHKTTFGIVKIQTISVFISRIYLGTGQGFALGRLEGPKLDVTAAPCGDPNLVGTVCRTDHIWCGAHAVNLHGRAGLAWAVCQECGFIAVGKLDVRNRVRKLPELVSKGILWNVRATT
jgi:hypothetical protein